MPREIHITNSAGVDTRVVFETARPAGSPRRGLPGREVSFRRYVAVAESGRHEVLAEEIGEDYAQALVDADPEVDTEAVGRQIQRTDTVYLSHSGEVLYAPPDVVEVILGPDGRERDRRAPEDVQANVKDEMPVRWAGRKLPKDKVVTRFAFRRTIQVRHVDGLTFTFLYDMAKELADEGVMVLVGAGEKGRDPLIFTSNGTPYRGFLEGRVDGERYKLLLHLSNMELKRPAPPGEDGGDA